MMTRLMTASVLALGLLTSVASAENGFCVNGASYDKETLTCVDNRGAKVTEAAGFAVDTSASQVNKGTIGDFIDESVTERNERSTSN